jgi:GH15 family glucan-1,4-alpha-glucosidase
MSRTLDALRSELGRGPLLYRYSGMPEEEGTFTACGFWMAAALACVGRIDEARELMDQLVDLGNDVGLYSEMIDADDHAFLGNLPQGLSHLALISAALTIEELSGGSARSTRTPRSRR